MKKLNLFLVLVMGCLTFAMASCSKDDDTTPNSNNNSNTIPDAVINAEVKENGAVIQAINFTLPKQDMNSGFAATGALNQSFFAMNIQELQKWAITLTNMSMANISKGTYPLDKTSGYNHLMENRASTAKSGTLEFTQVNLHAEVGNLKEYFVDGNFSLETKDILDTTRTYTITGTFSGVNIKQQ